MEFELILRFIIFGTVLFHGPEERRRYRDHLDSPQFESW